MSCTVGELIDFLAGQPRDRRVILAKDPEGNGFSPLASVQESMYVPTSAYAGESYVTPEYAARHPEYGDEDAAPEGAERVVELGPVN